MALLAAIVGVWVVALLAGGLSAVPVLAQGGSTSGVTSGGLSAVEGPETVVHAENDPRRVAAYRASGVDGAGIGWSLSGPDSGALSIAS